MLTEKSDQSRKGNKGRITCQGTWPKLCFFLLVNFMIISGLASHGWAARATAGDGQIQISWIAPIQNEDGSPLIDLAGYHVYRGLTREEQTERVNRELISGCVFVDTGLKNGQTYYYVVTAVDFSGNESAPSELVYATPTILPPAGFTAIGDDGLIKLHWGKSQNEHIRGYLLYRTLNPGQNYQKTTELPIEGTYFEDHAVENGVNFYYVITSLSDDGLESPYSEEQAATPIIPIPAEPSSLKALYEMGAVKLQWEPDPDDHKITGYHVYRRNTWGEKQFRKLTKEPLTETFYADNAVEENRQYLYSVVGVYANGVESKFPLEVPCYTKTLYIASITDNTEGKAKKAGDLITIIMEGEPGCQASFTIEDLTSNQPMKEIKPGFYYREFPVPAGINLAGAELTGTLSDAGGHQTTQRSARTIQVQNDPPPPVLAVSGEMNPYRYPQISWTPPPEESFAFVEVCSSTSLPDLSFPMERLVSVKKGISTYTDREARAGGIYYYMVRTVDEAGNRSKLSEAVRIDLGQETDEPCIASLSDDTSGIPVKAGKIIQVTAAGDRGCEASFSIENVVQGCPLLEVRPGVYQGQYTVKPEDHTEGAYIVAKFMDRAGRTGLAQGKNLLRINIQSNDQEPPLLKGIEHNGNLVAGISGKLVAGDSLCVRLFGEPGGTAFFSLGQNGEKIPLKETPYTAGEYQGTYIIRNGDDGEEITLYGYLLDQAGNMSTKMNDVTLAIDTRPIITIDVPRKNLPADRKSYTDILIKMEDLNGQSLSGHHIALTLVTTDEYTDVIGGGNFGQETDGTFAIDYEGVTDDMGRVKATYTAGFAAKTALIVAKDLDTGYAGVGYLTTFIESTLDISLKPRQMGRNLLNIAAGPGDAAYMILEAKPEKITADGRSTSRITARLLDNNRQPVTKPYRVTFTLSSQEGKLDHETITTDRNGWGYIRYTAGINIGTITITAVASRRENPEQAPLITECVQIVLMSDAPARIIMLAQEAAHDEVASLIAGSGQSLSVSMAVTDIHENPNPEATIQLQLQDEESRPSRNGYLSREILRTDRNGQATCTYTAGEEPGLVRIRAMVSSGIPTREELSRARGTLFVPLWPHEEDEFIGSFRTASLHDEEIGTIQEWLKREGDEVIRGEPVARLKIQDYGEMFVRAPYDGTLSGIKVMAGEDICLGQTIGFMDGKE
ncbi:MAG: invasin domain 3-containing protein [bacterium]